MMFTALRSITLMLRLKALDTGEQGLTLCHTPVTPVPHPSQLNVKSHSPSCTYLHDVIFPHYNTHTSKMLRLS